MECPTGSKAIQPNRPLTGLLVVDIIHCTLLHDQVLSENSIDPIAPYKQEAQKVRKVREQMYFTRLALGDDDSNSVAPPEA